VIHVLLVEDHASFRQPFAYMLEREPEITVVGQAGSLADARRLLAGVDLAIIDLDLPDGCGVELIKELRASNPHGKALILTASASREEWARAVEAGASGALHKSLSLEEVISVIRRLGAGEAVFSPDELITLLRLAAERREQDLDAQAMLARLTPRERAVLQVLAHGLNDKQMAERLQITTETVRTHMVNIFDKLDVDSRLQALVFAVRHGVVEIR
jgi:DNA-binding NarL/FixJ family response regulator